MAQKIIKIIATFGGLGYSRIAPGTAGSLGAAALYLLVKDSFILYAGALLLLLALGFLVSARAEGIFRAKDARPIVIDEACGMLIAMFFIPFSYTNLLIFFFIFRTMDIIKPFPIRKIEGLNGSLGIMGDDILAGLFANLIYRFILINFFLTK